MAEALHSKWSASGFEAVMLCPGKPVMEAGKADRTSEYAAEGNAAHLVLTWALKSTPIAPASAYLGRVIEADGYTFEVDDDMARHVQVCIDYVVDLMGADGILMVDERVNYSSYLGVPEDDAWGTADVIVIRGTEIIVLDFKYGRGVEVSAYENPQMSLYALGALQAYHNVVETFTHVRMAISQPRGSVKPSEYDLSVEELEAWGRSTARSAVASCMTAAAMWSAGMPDSTDWGSVFLNPNEKSCKFCRAKATCPSYREVVSETVFATNPATPEDFADLTVPGKDHIQPTEAAWLSAALAKADLIEDWVKAVRAEVERRLLAGDTVPGYKLVQGKKGNRAWSNKAEAEAAMKAMRLKVEEMYDLVLISPTSAEKLAPKYDKAGKVIPPKEGAPAPVIGPRQWPKLKELITQAEGKPHVAPVSDPREALTVKPIADEFEDQTDDQPNAATLAVTEFA